MAERLGCTESRISKLEHSDTGRITVKDLEDYSRNRGIDLVIRFEDGKIELSKSKGRTGEPSFEILGPEETQEEVGFAELPQ